MKNFLQRTSRFVSTNKLVAVFAVVVAFAIFSVTANASAAPDYFNVEKPSSVSQCDGGSWETIHHWQRHHWYWQRVRIQVWQPNWEKLGFDSYRQCVRYTSTEKPTSKAQCREEWRQLGFSSRHDCRRYLRLHPVGGYGGDESEG